MGTEEVAEPRDFAASTGISKGAVSECLRDMGQAVRAIEVDRLGGEESEKSSAKLASPSIQPQRLNHQGWGAGRVHNESRGPSAGPWARA